MVNHNSQKCQDHKKIHILMHLAEDVGFGDNYNKPEMLDIACKLHVKTYGFAVAVTELKFAVSKLIKIWPATTNRGYFYNVLTMMMITITKTITRYNDDITMANANIIHYSSNDYVVHLHAEDVCRLWRTIIFDIQWLQWINRRQQWIGNSELATVNWQQWTPTQIRGRGNNQPTNRWQCKFLVTLFCL